MALLYVLVCDSFGLSIENGLFLPPNDSDGWNSQFGNDFPRFSGCDLRSDGYWTKMHQSVFLYMFCNLLLTTPRSPSCVEILSQISTMSVASVLQQLATYGSNSSDHDDEVHFSTRGDSFETLVPDAAGNITDVMGLRPPINVSTSLHPMVLIL